MRVEVFTAVSAFQDLRAEWRQLLAQVPFQSVFFTPEWQETWWRHFGATRQLHLLTVRSSDGTLQGLVPLMSSPGIEGTARLELLGDLELCDYLDVLMAPARQHEVGHAVVEYLIGNGGEEVEVCLQNLVAAFGHVRCVPGLSAAQRPHRRGRTDRDLPNGALAVGVGGVSGPVTRQGPS